MVFPLIYCKFMLKSYEVLTLRHEPPTHFLIIANKKYLVNTYQTKLSFNLLKLAETCDKNLSKDIIRFNDRKNKKTSPTSKSNLRRKLKRKIFCRSASLQ